MSASHRRRPGFHPQDPTKTTLDHVLDFGPDDDVELTPEATHRLREIIRKIDEMTARIDRLCNQD